MENTYVNISNTLRGNLRIYSKTLDQNCLRVLLKHLNYRESDISAMINPDGKQNVPITVTPLKNFDTDIDPLYLPATFKDIVPCIKAMNIINQGVLALFVSTHLSIDELLGKVSAMSHLLLFLKTTDNVVISNVVYHDIQATMQNAFFTAAKFNIFQLESRLIRAAILDKIFIKYSAWKQNSVRLTVSSDYTNPKHWKGNCELKDVSIRTAWRRVERCIDPYCMETS